MTYNKYEYDKAYRLQHPEVIKEIHQRYRQKNANKVRERNKVYRDTHPEKMKEQYKKQSERSKEYMIEYGTRWRSMRYRSNIELLIEKNLLTDCIICGFPKELFAAIDFHHIKPEEKKATICSLLLRRDTTKLVQEASKCVCMCSNCHRLYHVGSIDVLKKYNKYMEKLNEKNEF